MGVVVVSRLESCPQKKNQTEEKAKVVAADWGTYLNATQSILPQGLIEEKIKEEYPFLEGAGLVWCKPEDHPFF